MSSGIWFAILDEVPGFEGVADLLPTNLLRGFFASDGEPAAICLDSSAIGYGEGLTR